MGQAEGAKIVVTNVVRELVEGKEHLFSDRGEADLKGFEEPVRLFEVRCEAMEWMADPFDKGRAG